MANQKSPPSEMIRVPAALVEVVRRLSQLHRQGHTVALLQGLEELISGFDSNIDSNMISTEKSIKQLPTQSSSTAKLEAKLEAIATRVAQLEGAMTMLQNNQNTRKPRSSAYSNYYSGQTPQLKPLNEKELAWRFGTNAVYLREKQQSLKTQDFHRWCEDRDPSRVRWQYNEKDGLYHPVK